MSMATVRTVFQRVFESGWSAPSLNVIWHAGEPLVLSPDYYREAFEMIQRMLPGGTGLRHAIQTNGMLITPAWCDLFLEYDVGVGVSIDGPRELHDLHRRTRSGRGTFDRSIAAVRLLRECGVPFHVISVLSHNSLDDPEAFIDFYLGEGIDQVCFNVEESEGDHQSSLFAVTNLSQRFSDFLQQFWRGARQRGKFTFIREIDGLLPRILRPEEAGMTNQQVVPLNMLNVACNGDVSTFSPELLGLRNAKYHDFVIGNVHTDTLATMRNSAAMSLMERDIAQGVEACRATCDYFSVCGGGAPINKLTENGSFATSRTRFCELSQIIPTDIILDALERLELVSPPNPHIS
jgi:uncharacterized protein